MSKSALKKGFVDGFIAPFTFLYGKPLETSRYQTSVGRAWEDVGAAFHEVMSKERATVGQERDKKRRAAKRAA